MNKAQLILYPPCQWTFSSFPGLPLYTMLLWWAGMCALGHRYERFFKCMPRSKMGWAVGWVPFSAFYNELWPKVIILSSSSKSSYYFTFLPVLSNVWFIIFCQFGGYEMVHQFISFTLFFPSAHLSYFY